MVASRIPRPIRFGRYEALGRIASGGMATVYFARAVSDLGLGQAVALKVMHPHLAEDVGNVRRLIDEARIGARIHHPNVVRLLDAVAVEGGLFLVLEYVHGASLAELLAAGKRRGFPPSPSVVASIVHQALLGLHGAHEARGEGGELLEVVHRDVSPQNILVSVAGTAHVADFGVARALERLHETKTNGVVGKMTYMAPEQLACAPLTRRTDLYATGVVLWESLAGEPLFGSHTLRASALAPGWTPPRPSDRNSEVTAALDAVVLRMLAHEPEKRFATAEGAATALAAACPLAPPSEVADWVKDVANDRLEELDVMLQAALRANTSLDSLASAVEKTGGRALVSSLAHAASTAQETPRARRTPLRRAAPLAVFLGLAGGVLLGTLAWRRRAPPRDPMVLAAPSPPPMESVGETPKAPLVTTPSVVAEAASSLPPAASTPTSTLAPRRPKVNPNAHAGARSASSAKSGCDPAYYIDGDGVKIFRPECVAR